MLELYFAEEDLWNLTDPRFGENEQWKRSSRRNGLYAMLKRSKSFRPEEIYESEWLEWAIRNGRICDPNGSLNILDLTFKKKDLWKLPDPRVGESKQWKWSSKQKEKCAVLKNKLYSEFTSIGESEWLEWAMKSGKIRDPRKESKQSESYQGSSSQPGRTPQPTYQSRYTTEPEPMSSSSTSHQFGRPSTSRSSFNHNSHTRGEPSNYASSTHRNNRSIKLEVGKSYAFQANELPDIPSDLAWSYDDRYPGGAYKLVKRRRRR